MSHIRVNEGGRAQIRYVSVDQMARQEQCRKAGNRMSKSYRAKENSLLRKHEKRDGVSKQP